MWSAKPPFAPPHVAFTVGARDSIPLRNMPSSTEIKLHALGVANTKLRSENERAKLELESAQGKLGVMKKELQESKADGRAARAHQDELREQHETCKTEMESLIASLSETVASYESGVMQLENKLADSVRNVQKHHDGSREYLSKVAHLVEQNQALEAKAASLTMVNTRLHDRLAQEINDHTSTRHERDNYKAATKSIGANAAQASELIYKDMGLAKQRHEAEMAEQKQEFQQEREAFGTMIKQLSSARSKLTHLGGENEKLHVACKTWAANREKLLHLIKCKDERQEELQTTIENLKKEGAQQQERREEGCLEMTRYIDNCNGEIERLQKELKATSNARDGWRSKVAELHDELDCMVVKHERRADAASAKWTEEKSRLQADIAKKFYQVQDIVRKQLGLQEPGRGEYDTVGDISEMIERMISAHGESLSHKDKEIAQLNDDASHLRVLFEEKEEELEARGNELAESKRRIQYLKSIYAENLKQKDAQIERLQTEMQEASVELGARQRRIYDQAKHYENRQEQLSSQVDVLKTERDIIKEELEKTKEMEDQYGRAYYNTVYELEELQRDSSKEIFDLKHAAKCSVSELEKVNEQTAEVIAVLNEKNTLVEDSLKRVMEREAGLEKLRNDNSIEIAALSHEIETQMAEHEDFREEAEEQIQNLEMRRTELRNQVEALQKIIQDREHEIDLQFDEIKDLKVERDKTHAVYEADEKVILEHIVRIRELRDECEDLKVKVSEQEEMLTFRNGRISDFRSCVNRLDMEKKELQGQVSMFREAENKDGIEMNNIKQEHRRELLEWKEKLRKVQEDWGVEALD